MNEESASQDMEAARQRLQERLRSLGRTLVAYSGGVDSAYLAWEAHQVLGENMLAVLADSPSLPRTHMQSAVQFAQQHGIALRIVSTEEMQRPEYVRNDAQRCFFCKDELFTVMEDLRAREGFETLAYGRNLDDGGEFRPGQKAAQNHAAAAPLAEAGLRKADVRALARLAGLAVWARPAAACLASRIEYGRPVTAEALAQVEQAEEYLAQMGFIGSRVRHHGELARIELPKEQMQRALSLDVFEQIDRGLRNAGFTYVALDLKGYRSGSMNAVLPVEVLLAGSGSGVARAS